MIVWLIKVYAISGHGIAGSAMPESEVVDRQDPSQGLLAFVKPHAQDPTYVFVVHLLGPKFSVRCINSYYTEYVHCLQKKKTCLNYEF